MSKNDVPPSDLAFGNAVQKAKGELLAGLGFPKGAWPDIEREARENPEASEAVTQWDSAVNAFWSQVYGDGTLDYLVATTKRRYRKLAQAIDTEDIHATAALLMRDFIVRYDPGQGVPFRIYLMKYGVSELAAALAPMAPGVTLPRSEIRADNVKVTTGAGSVRGEYAHLAEFDEKTRPPIHQNTDTGVYRPEPVVFQNVTKEETDA